MPPTSTLHVHAAVYVISVLLSLFAYSLRGSLLLYHLLSLLHHRRHWQLSHPLEEAAVREVIISFMEKVEIKKLHTFT